MKLRYLIVAFVLFSSSLQAKAESNDKLKLFLTSCAYGTAAGALLGVASLAFSSNPSGSLNNIAIGASLGLYAGIGMGFYFTQNTTAPKQELGSAYLTPEWHMGKVDGAEVHYTAFQF